MARASRFMNALVALFRHRYLSYTEPRVLGVLLTLILIPRLISRGSELVFAKGPASVVSVYVEPSSMIVGGVMLLAGFLILGGLLFRRTVLLASGHILALAIFVWYTVALVPGVIEAGRTYSAIWTSGLLPIIGHALRLWVLQYEIRRSFYGARK